VIERFYLVLKRRRKGMNAKKIATILLGFLMLSGVFVIAANAAPWPSLPSTTVQLTVVDGTTSYFVSTLSGVPSGFDVHNGVYPGWCVDRSTTMTRNAPHNVILYSSLAPPPALVGIDWLKINYILNHKQGSMMDVQEAIWYFTDALSPISPAAQAMVDAANANPYNPSDGAILAVICLPQEDPNAQNSIIEIKRCGNGLSPGYWKHNVKVYNGGPGHYSGTPTHESDDTMESYATSILAIGYPSIPADVDTPQEFLSWVNMRFQDNAYKKGNPSWLELANWFNAAAGLLPYSGD
jgi:hypothetical protein